MCMIISFIIFGNKLHSGDKVTYAESKPEQMVFI